MIRLLLVYLATWCASGQSHESIKAQMQSIAAQRQAIELYRTRDPVAEKPPECDPLPEAAVAPLVEGVAKARQLPARLLHAVIAQESGFRPCAVSKKGAQGLMQLMPVTAEQFAVADPFEPKSNVEAGAKFLRALIEKYKGDLSLALAAYNAGPAAVDEVKGIPDIKETRDYVESIVGKIGLRRIDLQSDPMPKPIEN